jgi:hypothetical protein
MRFDLPAWTVESYAHDRRAHRHRCRCCGKVLETGDKAFMARTAAKTTWAIHDACGEKRHSSQYTWREVMRVWAFDHQIKCWGLSKTEPRDWPKIQKYQSECGIAA